MSHTTLAINALEGFACPGGVCLPGQGRGVVMRTSRYPLVRGSNWASRGGTHSSLYNTTTLPAAPRREWGLDESYLPGLDNEYDEFELMMLMPMLMMMVTHNMNKA